MNSTSLRRPAAVVIAAIAGLAVMTAPASATTTHVASLTGGQLTLTKTGVTEMIDLAPATPTCPTHPTTTLGVEFGSTGTTIDVTSVDGRGLRPLGTGTYLSVLSQSPVGNDQGTISGTSVTSLKVGVVATQYNTASCTPTGTPICTLAFSLHLSGTLTGISTSQTFTLTGATVGSVTAFPTCTSGPSYLIGTTSTVSTAITGHLA